MLYVFAFTDFHDPERSQKLRALAESLGVKLPLGDQPLYSYAVNRPLPRSLPPESLIYLSDVVFHSAVALQTDAPPPAQIIARYANLAQLHEEPTLRISRRTGSLIDSLAHPGREAYALLPDHTPGAPRLSPRRRTLGILELHAASASQLLASLGEDALPLIVAHEPVTIDDPVTGFLLRDELDLAAIARIEEPCGILGFEHMDDALLVSVRGTFWRHPEDDLLRL